MGELLYASNSLHGHDVPFVGGHYSPCENNEKRKALW